MNSQSTPRQSFATQSSATLISTPRPSIATTLVGPSRTSIATTITPNGDGKRLARSKETQFLIKHGHKHHSFDAEKAPYPVSYDRHIVEMESLDNPFFARIKGSVSMISSFKVHPPERTLDLGCGSGSWVISAAREWPECEFVGFDLVNVQIKLGPLKDPSLSDRITWVHGNFLTTRLPFDDDEFDHVHVKDIARGVPENKWDFVFAEINRVLTPGGAVEIIEDDILFPVLPKWFTAPLRTRAKRTTSVHYPNGARPPQRATSDIPLGNHLPHDHALLEALYVSVFENRFINMRPSAILPIFFTTYFRQVQAAPVTNFPMPPVSPPQPLPQPLSPNASGLDIYSSTLFGGSSPPRTRPVSMSFSSTISAASNLLSASVSTSESTMISIFSADEIVSSSTESHEAYSTSGERSTSTPHDLPSPMKAQGMHSKRPLVYSSTRENPSIGPENDIVPEHLLNELSERSLAMHLFRSFQNVMSTQESMWEELKDWVRNKRGALKELDWEDDGDLEEPSIRRKFEKLLERYQGDMQTRISFWCSLTELGWDLPPKEPLSKAEHIEEERVHKAIRKAMESASEEDMQTPCRSARILIGFKEVPKYLSDFGEIQ